MVCFHVGYNPSSTFVQWRGIKSAPGNDAYSDPQRKEIAVPNGSLVINDRRNLDLNVQGDISDSAYACSVARTAEWIDHYEDGSGVVAEDSSGNQVVFAEFWSEIDLPTEFEGTAARIYTHETVEFFGSGTTIVGFKENAYPFTSPKADAYFKYYDDDSGFIGDIIGLGDKVDADFDDGTDGGVIYCADEVDYYVPFGSISKFKNTSKGFDVEFVDNETVLHFVEIAKVSGPAPLYKLSGKYINESMLWRDPANSKLAGGTEWPTWTHFIADYEADEWEYVKETWEAIAKGADAYNDLYSLPEYKARLARKTKQRASRRAPKGLQ